MADRPLLFSAPMVRALLEGRKTQTRRVLNWQPGDLDQPIQFEDGSWHVTDSQGGHMSSLPVRYRRMDRLWVRETWQGLSFGDYQPTKAKVCDLRYRATETLADLPTDAHGYPWRAAIHMPRWASRLTLIVTDVRVQRLQDISEADAVAEGCEATGWAPSYSNPDNAGCEESIPATEAFAALWNSINGAGAWDANPWVCALTFTVQLGNIDHLEAA